MEPASPADTLAVTEELTTSLQLLPLPAGVYSFTLKGNAPSTTSSEGLALPALQVGVAPTQSEGKIEFLSRKDTIDRWVIRSRDMIIAKISGGSVTLMLTSLRTQSSPVLAINIQRLDTDLFTAEPSLGADQTTAVEVNGVLPAQVVAHIHMLGDIPFNDGWAGCIGEGLWIEAFAIGSVGHLPLNLVEYCAVTADGFQTPWIGGKMFCGSRGRAIPMLGYAIRLKAEAAERYNCIYSGQFVSGRVLGPFKNGDLCCSDLPSDPLWGIELQVKERSESVNAKPSEDTQPINAVAS
jgi:hypothetical protein